MRLFKTIACLQNGRFVWLLMGLTALLLNLIAHYIFQIYMKLPPCELCVYIRFAMFAIFFGAVICAFKPKALILRLVFGYAMVGYGIIQGLIWNIRLEHKYWLLEKLKQGDFFALGGGAEACSLDPRYPLDLPLDIWFPSWFAPTGLCGGIDWHFFGFNMPECLFLFYAIYLIAFVLMIISFVLFRKSV